MLARFEELDFRPTPLGDLVLRRRTMTTLDNLEVYEILLGPEFLMSSLFTEVEEQLSHLGLQAASAVFPGNNQLDVVVGGLGLGYTARAALEHNSVRSLVVVDYLEPVIEWHQQGLVPLGNGLTADPRCSFEHGDFFKRAHANGGELSFDPSDNQKKFHAILLDIDHTPEFLLHDSHGSFYQPEGLRKMAEKIHPGGVFALWSDGYPIEAFEKNLAEVFPHCESHIVHFHNPIMGGESTGTVYVAKTHDASS